MLFQGCGNRSGAWDKNKSAMHLKDRDKGHFWNGDELAAGNEGVFGVDDDALALSDEDLKAQFAECSVEQSSLTPGEPGSGIPGISHFKDPTAILASIFRTIYFNTNSYTVQSQDHINILTKVAAYMKEHPNTYIFITGNCDERGPEAYNMALGTRRANTVRSILVQRGVSPDNIFTISYGKERPLDGGHNSQAWAKNRRAEFKIFER